MIVDSYMDWETLGDKLSSRNVLVQKAIDETEAKLPDGCGFIYNPSSIDANAGTALRDSADISIKRLIELRKSALLQELSDNGF